MEVELQKYKSFARYVRWFLVVSGIWPNYQPILKNFFAFSCSFTIFVVVFSATNFCFHNINNIRMVIKAVGLIIGFSTALMKVIIFLLHHDDLMYLNEFLTTRYLKDLKNVENQPDLLYRVRIFYSFMCTHAISGAITMSMYVLNPLLVLRKHGIYVRAYPAVYPFTYELGGIVHWIIYAIEAISSYAVLFVIVGVDYIFGLYTLQMCGELRILAKRFNNLQIDKNYQRNLKDCIKRHHLLINVKNKLEDIFGLITIWLFISGAFNLCSLIFQVFEGTKQRESLMHTCHICCYLVPKFLQIFAYAYNGYVIAEESGACLDSIYYSRWSDQCNSRFKRDILIVLTQDPLTLVAKGCMVVQMDMFTKYTMQIAAMNTLKIVKASVSYFCLLRTINEANAL